MNRPPARVSDLLHLARRRAARAMRVERMAPILAPAVAGICGFAALALISVPQSLPLWLHGVLLLLLLGFVATRLWVAIRRVPEAPPEAIDRRIERQSGLRHRPLQTLDDQPANDQPQDAIWQAHRQRTLDRLHRLRAGPPRLAILGSASGLLCLACVPALLLAWILAGTAAPRRLALGFLPGLVEPVGAAPRMQAWITPPGYTGAAPVFLTDPHGETTVPFGSVLQISLTGLHGSPKLGARDLDPAHPDRGGPLRFARLSEGSWALTRSLEGSVRLALRGNGRALADWTIQVAPLPSALLAWDGSPGRSNDSWKTRLPWRAAHPYGLNALAAEIRLADAKPGAPAPALRVPILIAPGTREAHGVAVADLSADPRAGETVTARLVATDVAGRTLYGPEARFALPERTFRNPLARAVLDSRKRIALGREDRDDTASDLQAIGDAPGPFASDSGMFLNLASIAALLRQDGTTNDQAIDEAVGRLWELALALEDGLHNDRPGARAAADVRAAREAVEAQLEHMRQLGDKGQSDKEQSELERRIRELSAAIARRMQALAEQAAREHTVLPPMPDAKMLTGDDLSRMMQQMRDQAAHGDAQGAMQKLAQMQSMLERMRAATPQDLQNAQRQAEVRQQVREQMEGLHDLVRRQSSLLDQAQARHNAQEKMAHPAAPSGGMDEQTAELLRRLGISEPQDPLGPPSLDEPGPPAAAGPGPAPPNPASPDPGARDNPSAEQARKAQRGQDTRFQHSLARALDELGDEFKALSGAKPGGFDEAIQAMNRAHDALAKGQDQMAEDAQQQAIAALQKGAHQMQQALAAGRGGMSVLMPGMAASGEDGQSEPGQAANQSGGSEPGDDPDTKSTRDGDREGTRDPLGRLAGNGSRADDGDTRLPDKAEQMRAREIEQELRRRDTDRTRPADELHYLDRLLKPF